MGLILERSGMAEDLLETIGESRANSSRKWIPELAKNQIFRGFWMIPAS
jgi:TRAP-type mannitol/chloroaromatic compound transport system permease large subunit